MDCKAMCFSGFSIYVLLTSIFLFCFVLFCCPSSLMSAGPGRMPKHGSKVKGNAKKELDDGCSRETPPSSTPHPTHSHTHTQHSFSFYQSKYHCYIAYNFQPRCRGKARSGREDRHLLFVLFLVCLRWIGGPANLCDSLATECLPAAESSALQQPSSPPHCLATTTPLLARCLPADPYRPAPPPLLLPGLRAESSSQKLPRPPAC